MHSTLRWIAAVSLLFLSLVSARAQTSNAELALGVAAYKNSRYEESIWHFQKAVDLDSGNMRARMYLATALVSQYIPGVDTPDNQLLAERAIDQYQHVLDSDVEREQKVNSAKGIAYLLLNMKKFGDSKKYYQMASDLDPQDPEPFYSMGVIDWTACYQPRMEARARLGMRPEEHLNPQIPEQKKACCELAARNGPSIEEGIASLNKAIQLRPDYDDAMAYMNLMYREKADLECDDPAARAEDLKIADEWVDKTIATKKAKAQRFDAQKPQPADQQ